MPKGVPSAHNSSPEAKRKPGRPRAADAKPQTAQAAHMAASSVSAPSERRKPGRPKGSVNKKKLSMAPAKTRSAGTPRPVLKVAPAAKSSMMAKISKDDLRARVDKLERANAVLRAKSRDSTRAAKAAADQVAGLEAQLAKFERASARRETPSKTGAKA